MKKYSTIEDLGMISESALESSLAGFWDWNMVTNEEYLSPRFKEMFGYTDHEMDNTPDSWQKIAFQEDLPQMFQRFDAHVKSGGKTAFNSILRFYHKNGHTIWVRCNGKVVEWSDNGAPLRAIGCHVDITEEKEMEEKLKKAISDRDILLKEVHHRVKNNLQLLLSLTRLKTKGGLIEASEIEDSIKSIAIAYEAIYKTDRLNQVSVETYISQITTPLIEGHDIDFTLDSIDFNSDIDFLIPLGLVLNELTNNSLKHAFDDVSLKKINIIIGTEKDRLTINYSDNGVGYNEAVLGSVESNDSLGISIMMGLVEQLNGEIKFYNNNGAQVKITLTKPDCS